MEEVVEISKGGRGSKGLQRWSRKQRPLKMEEEAMASKDGGGSNGL
jgi:hypothetical protein